MSFRHPECKDINTKFFFHLQTSAFYAICKYVMAGIPSIGVTKARIFFWFHCWIFAGLKGPRNGTTGTCRGHFQLVAPLGRNRTEFQPYSIINLCSTFVSILIIEDFQRIYKIISFSSIATWRLDYLRKLKFKNVMVHLVLRLEYFFSGFKIFWVGILAKITLNLQKSCVKSKFLKNHWINTQQVIIFRKKAKLNKLTYQSMFKTRTPFILVKVGRSHNIFIGDFNKTKKNNRYWSSVIIQ